MLEQKDHSTCVTSYDVFVYPAGEPQEILRLTCWVNENWQVRYNNNYYRSFTYYYERYNTFVSFFLRVLIRYCIYFTMYEFCTSTVIDAREVTPAKVIKNPRNEMPDAEQKSAASAGRAKAKRIRLKSYIGVFFKRDTVE